MQEVVVMAVRAAVMAATMTFRMISQTLFFFIAFRFCRVDNFGWVFLRWGSCRFPALPWPPRAAASRFRWAFLCRRSLWACSSRRCTFGCRFPWAVPSAWWCLRCIPVCICRGKCVGCRKRLGGPTLVRTAKKYKIMANETSVHKLRFYSLTRRCTEFPARKYTIIIGAERDARLFENYPDSGFCCTLFFNKTIFSKQWDFAFNGSLCDIQFWC